VTLLTVFRFSGVYSTYTSIALNVWGLVWVQFSYHGVLEGLDEQANISFYRNLWYYILFANFVYNYNTFLATVIWFPIINIVFYHYQLQIQFEKERFNIYDSEALEDEEYEKLYTDGMKMVVTMVFLFCAHTYVVQKDLITLAIKNRMVSRQQSQLTEFLGEQ